MRKRAIMVILLVAEIDTEADKMLEESAAEGKWKSVDENVLLKILMSLNLVDLVMRVRGVCQSWRQIAQEQCLWRVVDMDKIMIAFSEPNNHDFLSLDTMQKMESILACSRGNVTTLICSTYSGLYVPSWVSIAERTPMLEKLVLLLSRSIPLSGFSESVKRWPALKSLTFAGVTSPKRLMKAIPQNCPDFSELKYMGPVSKNFTYSIITYLCKLKVLSLCGSFIHKEALDLILRKHKNLEVLNISHCLMIVGSPQVVDS